MRPRGGHVQVTSQAGKTKGEELLPWLLVIILHSVRVFAAQEGNRAAWAAEWTVTEQPPGGRVGPGRICTGGFSGTSLEGRPSLHQCPEARGPWVREAGPYPPMQGPCRRAGPQRGGGGGVAKGVGTAGWRRSGEESGAQIMGCWGRRAGGLRSLGSRGRGCCPRDSGCAPSTGAELSGRLLQRPHPPPAPAPHWNTRARGSPAAEARTDSAGGPQWGDQWAPVGFR